MSWVRQIVKRVRNCISTGNHLGHGYKKVGYTNAGTPRYVSADGLRQMRFDTPHMYKGEMIGKHLNLEMFKGRKPIPYEHVLYDLFRYWIL